MNNDTKKTPQLIVISAGGTDRAGVVNELSKVILDCGGNIEESRMTALGAEFAMLLLVSGNWATLGKLESALDKLAAKSGMSVEIRKTDQREAEIASMPFMLDIVSLDQPGIVFQVSSFLAARNIEIGDLATRRYAAAHTGSQMFAVQMTVNVPSTVHIAQLRDDYFELCDRMNVDGILEPVKG